MHELSIAMSLLEIIERTARANGMSRVTKVLVKAGELTSVEPESLSFCFNEIKKESIAASAELLVEVVPLQGCCPVCGSDFDIKDSKLFCSMCGNRDIRIIAGEELCLFQVEGES